MPETPLLPNPACGALISRSGESLPLTGVRVEADVHPGSVTVEVTATFVNDRAQPLEVTYLAPLPAGFAPVAAECRLAGGTVRAELVARADARRRYDDAVAEGRTAAIAEQVGEDLFSMTIGNIAADEVATIRIALVGTADVDDGQATLRLPLSTGERYQPTGTTGRQPPRRGHAGDREPTATVVVRTQDVTPTVTSHDASYETDGSATIARMDGVSLTGDVVVRWPASPGWTAMFTPGEGRGWLTVTGTTEETVERAGRDVVVLLDRSGSMGGWQMGAARDVAHAIADRLHPADRLCVLAFDTELEVTPGAVGFGAADAAHRRRVQDWLGTIEARGGTELTRAFVTAAGLLADSHGRGTIVIVTDAEIGDEARCLAAIRMSDADVLTVGVGSRVNRGLIRAIAETSGGWSTIVESPERLEEAVGDIARRCAGAAQPVEQLTVEGASRVEWSGPHPRLIAGHETVLRAEVEGAPTSVTLSGPGHHTTVPVTADGVASAHHLWARASVAAMLRAPEVDEAAAQRIALEGSVLCVLTAFVAVDSSGRQLDATPARVEVGHLGWAGAGGGAPMPMMAMAAPAPSAKGSHSLLRMSMADAAMAPMASRPIAESAPPPAATFAELRAEIAAFDGRDVTAAERSRLVGDWAERVAGFLDGSDASEAKALAAKLAAAVIGGDTAWADLVRWCAVQL